VRIGMGITSFDDRGRVVIPKELRDKLDLKPDQNLIIEVRDGEIVLRPSFRVEEFAAELRGCIRRSQIKPDELKEIWGVAHAHH